MPHVTLDLCARRNTVQLPIIWRLGQLFNVVTNIRRARVSEDAAYVRLDIEGSTQEVDDATAYLRSHGLLTSEANTALVAGKASAPEDSISNARTILVRLDTVDPEQDHVPVLYRVGKDYKVVVNIERAEFDDEEGGYVEVALTGTLGDVQRAIAYLHTTGLHIFPRERSVRDGSNL